MSYYEERLEELSRIVPQNNFEELYEWIYDVLPPFKEYTYQKWFYKGINSTSEKTYHNVKIYKYVMALYYTNKNRHIVESMDNDLFLQKMVKEYWKRWWLWKGCISMPPEDAKTYWLKEVAYLNRIQENYIENVTHLNTITNGKWRGRDVLNQARKKRK